MYVRHIYIHVVLHNHIQQILSSYGDLVYDGSFV